MFAKLATTLAVGRRDARRAAAIPDRHGEVCSIAPPLRGRRVLVCHWTIDPACGRPVCAWQPE